MRGYRGAVLLASFLLVLFACGPSVRQLNESECIAFSEHASDTIMTIIGKTLPEGKEPPERGTLVIHLSPGRGTQEPIGKVNVIVDLDPRFGGEVSLKTGGGSYQFPLGRHSLWCDDYYFFSSTYQFTVSKDKCAEVNLGILTSIYEWKGWKGDSLIARKVVNPRDQWVFYRISGHLGETSTRTKRVKRDDIVIGSQVIHQNPIDVSEAVTGVPLKGMYAVERAVLTREVSSAPDKRVAQFSWKVLEKELLPEDNELWAHPELIPGIPDTLIRVIRSYRPSFAPR